MFTHFDDGCCYIDDLSVTSKHAKNFKKMKNKRVNQPYNSFNMDTVLIAAAAAATQTCLYEDDLVFVQTGLGVDLRTLHVVRFGTTRLSEYGLVVENTITNLPTTNYVQRCDNGTRRELFLYFF
jgi:hypothetical protein